MTTILTCMWLLMLVTFSAPGREGPSSIATLDWIALLKIVTRVGVFVALATVVLRGWRAPQRRAVSGLLWPLFAFVLWAVTSVLWSPLPAVSLGQAFTTGVLVLLAMAVASEWRDESHTSAVLMQLTLACLAVSAILIAVQAVVGAGSGFDRSLDEGGSLGLMHPTSAGATASLGLVALVSVATIWRWLWSRVALWPAVPAHVAVLFFALSRTGLGLAVLLLGILALRRGNRLAMAGGALGLSLGAVVYPVIDPGFILAGDVFGASAQYVSRGESVETMRTLTGRTELWRAVWASTLESPIVGWGYHVASSDGILDVWGRPAVRTAHNLPLQIVASTGVVGLGLFAFGLIRPIRSAMAALRRDESGRRLRQLLVVVGGWYFGWSLLSESFMGPLQPESVFFFAVLGLAVGQTCGRRS